jgi:hypothetical protein
MKKSWPVRATVTGSELTHDLAVAFGFGRALAAGPDDAPATCNSVALNNRGLNAESPFMKAGSVRQSFRLSLVRHQ